MRQARGQGGDAVTPEITELQAQLDAAAIREVGLRGLLDAANKAGAEVEELRGHLTASIAEFSTTMAALRACESRNDMLKSEVHQARTCEEQMGTALDSARSEVEKLREALKAIAETECFLDHGENECCLEQSDVIAIAEAAIASTEPRTRLREAELVDCGSDYIHKGELDTAQDHNTHLIGLLKSEVETLKAGTPKRAWLQRNWDETRKQLDEQTAFLRRVLHWVKARTTETCQCGNCRWCAKIAQEIEQQLGVKQ